MDKFDFSSLEPSGSISLGYNCVYVVDIKDIDDVDVLISLNVEGSRLYNLITSFCSNGYIVSVRPVLPNK